MRWRLAYSDTAEKDLSKLDKAMARKLMAYMDELCNLVDPADRGHALTGPLPGKHRYRIGQLRIICDIQRGTIVIYVLKISRRDSIY
jgi:mRNA interferase RelE/StbE